MNDRWKWAYTYVLLAFTIGWAVFTVKVVLGTLMAPTPIDVLKASGTSVLLGALIAWGTAVNQFWFRKKAPKDNK